MNTYNDRQKACGDDDAKNRITLDRRDLWDYIRGAIHAALHDKIPKDCVVSWAWEEATNRTLDIFNKLETTSPMTGFSESVAEQLYVAKLTIPAPADDAKAQIEHLDVENHRLRSAIFAMMKRLTELLDEDQFAEMDSIALAAGVTPPESVSSTDSEFKNFHSLLCERFDYVHDEKDWKRDQLSLIEHIAKRAAPSTAAQGATLTDERLTELAVDHLHIDYDRMPAGVVPLLRAAIALAAAKPVSVDAAGTAADSGLTGDELEIFRRTDEQFGDCGETDTDHATLMKWANQGLLDCTRFTVTEAGRALLAPPTGSTGEPTL
jgi:hypothetical protein